MPQIQQLSAHVADLIAAGEVVERPASVVKELLENAIDAGASAVTVEISGGGMTLIRVTDDGCGIAPDEVEVAFLRHATSKIRCEADLEAIGTLGFRGEALAAISAVSRVEIMTKPIQHALGTALTLEGGVVVELEEAGCPNGTTMVVRNLFYNTPARLKFMKRDASEGAAAFAIVQRCALSHPEVSVKFLRDGKQELLTPGDSQLKSAIYSVFGRDIALGLTPVKGSGEGMVVTGFVSLPTCCRGTRGYQHLFVNGRYVKSRTMMAALEEAYKNQKMVGKFPACVLHLETKLSTVDVNVHPTKTEVKFVSDRHVFDAVYYAVLAALGADHSHPAVSVTSPPAPKPAEHLTLRDVVTPQRTTVSYLGGGAPTPPPAPVSQSAKAAPPPPAPLERPDRVTALPEREIVTPPVAVLPPPQATPVTPPAPATISAPEPEPVVAEELPWRVAGEVLSTYIIVEQGDTVLLIDKHAAHERMNFDRLKAESYRPMAQRLLAPVVFTPQAEEGATLLQHAELLGEFGFEVEGFGGGALLVRQTPCDVTGDQVEATLTELAAKLMTTGRADPDSQRDHLLHTIACKAAIKGGQKNDPAELVRVAQAVMDGSVKFCPHGRPVAIQLTRKELEKQFKRQ